MKIRFCKPRSTDVVIYNLIEGRITELKIRKRFRVVATLMRLELFGFAGLVYIANEFSYGNEWEKTEKDNVFISHAFPNLEAAIADLRFHRMIDEAA